MGVQVRLSARLWEVNKEVHWLWLSHQKGLIRIHRHWQWFNGWSLSTASNQSVGSFSSSAFWTLKISSCLCFYWQCKFSVTALLLRVMLQTCISLVFSVSNRFDGLSKFCQKHWINYLMPWTQNNLLFKGSSGLWLAECWTDHVLKESWEFMLSLRYSYVTPPSHPVLKLCSRITGFCVTIDF
jgi:hypothetical protein